MEPLAAWELGLSGNGTRQPLPTLTWFLHPFCSMGALPSDAPILLQPQGDPRMVTGRQHPASPAL